MVQKRYDGNTIGDVTLFSEKGAVAKLENPWPGRKVEVTPEGRSVPPAVNATAGVVEFPTVAGTRYRIRPV